MDLVNITYTSTQNVHTYEIKIGVSVPIIKTLLGKLGYKEKPVVAKEPYLVGTVTYQDDDSTRKPAIEAIKELRDLTGMTLKDAKTALLSLEKGPVLLKTTNGVSTLIPGSIRGLKYITVEFR